MSGDISANDFDSMAGPRGGRERVASGKTRVAWVSRQYRLLAIALTAATAATWSGFLGRTPPRGRAALVGHARLVESVAFAPDGHTLASCGFDGTVRLWDLAPWDGRRPAASESLEHPSVVFATAFSADGSRLAAVGDRFVTIWSRNPAYHREVERQGETFHGAAFAPDGRTLALGAEDGTIRLWDLPEARERAVLRGHTGTVRCLAFSPDGKLLVSGSQEGRLLVWDPARGTRLRTLVKEGGSPIRAVAFAPDGRTLGVADATYRASDVILYDVETGSVSARLRGHPLGINDIAFSRDGGTVATAGVDRAIRLWDLSSSTELAVVPDATWLKSLSLSGDGRWLAFAGGDEQIRLLDLNEYPGPRAAGNLPSATVVDCRADRPRRRAQAPGVDRRRAPASAVPALVSR